MENIDLKMMWQKANIQNKGDFSRETNIEEIIRMNHSKVTAKVLSDIKLKIMLYSAISAIYLGLMLYAFVYLGLHLSLISILPLLVVGLFLFTQTITEISRFLVFTKNTDNLSLKESVIYFRRKLNRIKIVDFLSYLILFYLLAIWIIRGYIRDVGGFQNLSGSNAMQTFILILIVILLLTPWFLKYQNNQQYRKIDSTLIESMKLLNDEES
jgi:hypothetical protein